MDWTIEFDKAIEQYLPDLEVLQDEPMSRHTTFRIGGPAKRMAFPSSREQLVLLMSFAKNYGANPLVIGNGSNLLVPDEGLDRLVIDTSANLNRVERGSGNTVLADAGATLARTADLACKSGLTGLEFAHGIPGTVGGGVCMNAGAYGGEMKQVLRSAAVLFPEEGIRTLSCEELNLSYRHSLLTEHPEAVVLYSHAGADGKAQGQPALGMAQRGQYLQAAGGPLCRDAHRPMRSERTDGGGRAGFGKTRGLPHQPGRRNLRGHGGVDPSGAAAGTGGNRRHAGAGGQNR